jgi:hypothetical protein
MEKITCSFYVHHRDGTYTICNRPAAYEIDGHHFCRMHTHNNMKTPEDRLISKYQGLKNRIAFINRIMYDDVEAMARLEHSREYSREYHRRKNLTKN